MSESTSANQNADAHPAAARRRRKRAGALAEVPWFGISLLIHTLALVALVAWANPFDRDPEEAAKEDRDIVLSGDRLAEVVEQVRAIQQRELQNRLDELQAIEHQMEQMRQELNQPYREFSQELAEQAIDKALDAQQKALDEQAQALEQQAQDQLAAAKQDQIETAEAQDEAMARMAVSPAGAAAMDAQDAAQQAQRAADQALDQARQAEAELSKATRDAENDLERKARDLAKREEAVAKAEAETERHTAQQTKQEDELAKALDAGQDKQIKRETADLEKAQRKTKEAEKKVAEREQAVAEREQDIAEREAEAKAELAAKAEAAAEAKAAAEQAQREARAKQEEALAKTAEAKAAAETMAMTGEDIPQPDMSQAYAAPEDLAATYDAAAQTEQRIAQRFQDLRAAELAMIRDISIDQAKAIIELPKPDRAGLDEELLGKEIRSDEEIPAHEAEIEKALSESAAMVNLANDLLTQLQQQQHSTQQGHSLGAMRAAAQAQAASEAQVQEGEGANAADVTGLMKQAAGAGGALPYGNGAGRANLVTYNGPHAVIVKQDQAQAGRTITTRPDVAGAEWMYIDTWHIIGPFGNEGRRNIDTRFPPESVVDLDATYAGKGGRPISWQFWQGDRPVIDPPNAESWAIYYAYTEVRCDRPLDLWMAVGSDDKSHIWINDVLVWVSEPHHKAWKIGEGYRKIHLQQGRNRILYRVENGQFGMGFSLVLHTDPEKVER